MPPGFSGFVEVGLSFSPEKTQIELACDVAATFSVPLPGGPITSLATAALALAPVRAAVQTTTASNDFLRIAYLPIWGPVASQASPGPSSSKRPYSDRPRSISPWKEVGKAGRRHRPAELAPDRWQAGGCLCGRAGVAFR